MSVKNPALAAYSIIGLIGGSLLTATSKHFQNTAPETFVDPKLVQGITLFLGLFIAGISLLGLVVSLIRPER